MANYREYYGELSGMLWRTIRNVYIFQGVAEFDGAREKTENILKGLSVFV